MVIRLRVGLDCEKITKGETMTNSETDQATIETKVLNGFNLARIGRFDLEHSPEDDRLIVYVKVDDETFFRVYINADGTTSRERVSGTTFDDPHWVPAMTLDDFCYAVRRELQKRGVKTVENGIDLLYPFVSQAWPVSEDETVESYADGFQETTN